MAQFSQRRPGPGTPGLGPANDDVIEHFDPQQLPGADQFPRHFDVGFTRGCVARGMRVRNDHGRRGPHSGPRTLLRTCRSSWAPQTLYLSATPHRTNPGAFQGHPRSNRPTQHWLPHSSPASVNCLRRFLLNFTRTLLNVVSVNAQPIQISHRTWTPLQAVPATALAGRAAAQRKPSRRSQAARGQKAASEKSGSHPRPDGPCGGGWGWGPWGRVRIEPESLLPYAPYARLCPEAGLPSASLDLASLGTSTISGAPKFIFRAMAWRCSLARCP